MVGLTKVAALDCGTRGIRVNAICSGKARPPMVDQAGRRQPSLDAHASAPPDRAHRETDVIAQAAVCLCTSAAAFVIRVAPPLVEGYVVP